MDVRAIANNDIVYLWWTYDQKIEGCLGFTVRRIVAGHDPEALPAFVGFDPPEKGADPSEFRKDTDRWPIQSYQWKDLFVPEDTDVSYEIVPLKGTPKHLKPIEELKLTTGVTRATESFGPVTVCFNRGIISTQALTKKLPKTAAGGPKAESLRAHIGKPKDKIRKSLAGDAEATLCSLLRRAREQGGTCYLALYELTDEALIQEIEKTAGQVELILSNADGSRTETGPDGKPKTIKVYDKTNAATRKRLRKKLGKSLHDRLLPKGNAIGHNKFVVYADDDGVARAVLTGSTNWTPTGLCAQSNNALIIEDDEVAGCYLEYWKRLLADKSKQAHALRTVDAETPPEIDLGDASGRARIWFSPNTVAHSVPKNPVTPVDIQEVFARIHAAKDGVLFLVFSPGSRSILSEIKAVAQDRKAAGKCFFVRGAISDAATAEAYRTRVYNDSILNAPNTLITGIAAVPDYFTFWEKELAKLGYAVIHDKIVVVDPFREDGCVITGSHNLGFKASYCNDENLAILSGDRRVVEAYTAHVLDVVNHYNWRESLQPAKPKKPGDKPKKKPRFDSLAKTDAWQDKYFKGSFLASRDRFFFPEP